MLLCKKTGLGKKAFSYKGESVMRLNKHKEMIESLNAFVNENGEYTTVGGSFTDRIGYRYKNLKGTFVVEIGELVDGVVMFLIEYINKEEGEEFSAVVDNLFKGILNFTQQKVNVPFLILGIGENKLKDSWKPIIKEYPLIPLSEKEQNLISLVDIEEIKWSFYEDNRILKDLMPALITFQEDWEDFISCRKQRDLEIELYYKAAKKVLINRDTRIRPLVTSINPIEFAIEDINDKEVYKIQSLESPVTELFNEYLESNKFKWLLDDKIPSNLMNFVNKYRADVDLQLADEVKKSLSLAGWTEDDIDVVFNLLNENDFSDYIYGIKSYKVKKSTIVIKQIEITTELNGKVLTIRLKLNNEEFVIKAENGLPFNSGELSFKKIG